MCNHHSKFSEAKFGVVCVTMLLVGLSPLAMADPGKHAQEDTFAAEAAALLPAPAPLVAGAAPAPTARITLGDWSAVIAWTPHIPVSAAALA